jgi:hypothetical protein
METDLFADLDLALDNSFKTIRRIRRIRYHFVV